MAAQTAALARATGSPRRRGLLTVPAVAGLAYTASWLAGLAIAPSSTSVRSTGAAVVAGFAGHEGAAVTQFVLTEGIASLALAVVVICLGRAGLRAGAGTAARLMIGAAAAAAAVGLVQCVLGVYLTVSVVPADHASTAAAVSDAVNRLDGVEDVPAVRHGRRGHRAGPADRAAAALASVDRGWRWPSRSPLPASGTRC